MIQVPASSTPPRVAPDPGLEPTAGWRLVDAALCLLNCSLGAVSGIVAGTLLGWTNAFSAVLAVVLAPLSCLFLTDCPVARRVGLALRQYG